MAARVFVRIFALIGVVLSGCSGLDLSVESNHVQLGGTIVITCTTMIDFDSVATWKKMYPEDPVKPYVIIADNNVLNVPFKAIGRYSMNLLDLGDNIYEFTLTITEAVVEDSGNFTCGLSNINTKMVSVSVVVPPERVEMTLGEGDGPLHIINDDEELKFDGGQKRRVICNVDGGNPAPKVRIMAGDIDITHEFTVSTITIREPTDTKGLVTLRSSVTAEAKELLMKGIYSGKKIACTAVPIVKELEPMSVGFIAKFSGYKPLIECYDTLISFIHQTNVNITCRVIARPKPDKIFFYYYLKGTNATIELQAGQSQGHYRGEIHNGDNEETSEMVLFIDRVFPQMFRHYYFVAESTFGKTEHKVYLERDRSRESGTNDATHIGGVIALLTLAVVTPLLSFL